MRRLAMTGTVLLLLVLIACESPDQGGKTSGGITAKEVEKKAAAAVKAFSDFATQKNSGFAEQMEKQLAELDQKIRTLNAKVARLGAEAGEDLKDMADRMGKQSAKTRKKLAELGSATGERVEALKDSINDGVGALKESYEKADSSTK